MEILSRKTEKEKLSELEAMLADANATCNGEVTDDASLVSFDSEAPTPTKDLYAPPSPRQDASPLAWRPGGWSRSGNHVVDITCSSNISMMDSLCGAASGEREAADVTAHIYSSSSSNTTASSAEAVVARGSQQEVPHHSLIDRRRRRATPKGDDATSTVALLTNELVLARSQAEQKDVVARSLQRQLDQRRDVEAQTQARAEEELVAALAKVSGLKEELARTSQLLVDGALARQNLEQRCSLLTQDLHKSIARTAELEDEVSVSRAELVRISGALHARRGTDVVEAERAFGEELQRVQESARREVRGLKQEASGLRASLAQTKAKFRKTCGERDSWREEADALSSEAATLRETVHALRQYSENDIIDQLLAQVSRWKRRAEELENLQRVSSPEQFASDGSNSEMEQSRCTEPLEPLLSPGIEGGATLAAVDPTATPSGQEEEEHKELVGQGEKAAIYALRQELAEAKRTLVIKEGEVVAAVLEAREEAAKRVEAETCVKSLQREAEANARTAREEVVARRTTKARDMANLKKSIQQDMVDELRKLQCEVKKQRLEEQSHWDETTPCASCSNCGWKSLGVDKACQANDTLTSSSEAEGEVFQNYTLTRLDAACSTCLVDLTESAAADCSSASNEGGKLVSDALASAATAQVGATAWASAFSAAGHLFHAALVSLIEQVSDVLGVYPEGNGRKVLVVSPLAGVRAAGYNEASSAVIPWVPNEAKSEAATALEVLRGKVELGLERIRLALAEHAKRATVVPLALTVTTAGSQTTPEPPPISVTALSRTTTGSQTAVTAAAPRATTGTQIDREPKGVVRGSRRHDVAVQAGSLWEWRAAALSSASGASGAPAWEGDMGTQCFGGKTGDDHRGRRRKLFFDDARMELERKANALSAALQRAEDERRDLEQSLTRRFEHEKAEQLKRLRDEYEADISALHASTVALVHDFPINSAA